MHKNKIQMKNNITWIFTGLMKNKSQELIVLAHAVPGKQATSGW